MFPPSPVERDSPLPRLCVLHPLASGIGCTVLLRKWYDRVIFVSNGSMDHMGTHMCLCMYGPVHTHTHTYTQTYGAALWYVSSSLLCFPRPSPLVCATNGAARFRGSVIQHPCAEEGEPTTPFYPAVERVWASFLIDHTFTK